MYEDDDFDELEEPLNVECPYNGFVSNKFPKNLEGECYKYENTNFMFSSRAIKFLSAEIVNIQEYLVILIIVNIFFCVSFYINLASAILTYNVTPIVFSSLIYVLASIFQLSIVPDPQFYKSRIDFDENMKKLLNSTFKISIATKNYNNKTIYPINYINDITGTINIPNDIKYVKIEKLQVYLDKNVYNFLNKYENINGSWVMLVESFYNDKLLDDESIYCTYNLNSNSSSYSINLFRRIVCLLLIQWIFALYDKYKSTKCVVISPAKYISKNKHYSDTNIFIHGKQMKLKKNICLNMKSKNADNVNKLYNQKMDKIRKENKKREEQEREKQRKEDEEWRKKQEKWAEEKRILEENTEILSTFKDKNNFTITVKRVYDDVKIYLEIFQYKKKIHETIDAGEYDSDQDEEDIEEDGDSNIYYPRGTDISIRVTYYQNKYVIKVGSLFTNSYYYKS